MHKGGKCFYGNKTSNLSVSLQATNDFLILALKPELFIHRSKRQNTFVPSTGKGGICWLSSRERQEKVTAPQIKYSVYFHSKKVPGLFFNYIFFSFLLVCTWLEICIYGIPNCFRPWNWGRVEKVTSSFFFFQTVLQWAVWSILGVRFEASLCLIRGPNNAFCQWRFSQR